MFTWALDLVRNRGYTYTDTVDAGASGRTILDFYADRYPHSDRTTWASRISDGVVQRNGEPASPDTPLDPGDQLTYHRPPWVEPEAPVSFAVLYQDAHVLAVAKPSGLPVLPGGQHLENTLLAAVRRLAPGADPVHRLGRGTSGTVLFALTKAARRALSRDFHNRRVTKIYRALVTGSRIADAFTVHTPIGRVPYPGVGQLHAASSDGRPSTSAVRTLHRIEDRGQAVVEVNITTGRPHQIRIHLAAAGHPLVGDPLYIPGGLPVTAPDASGRWPLPGDVGYHLHAIRVEFRHPESCQPIQVECFPPPVLRIPIK